MSNRKPGPGGSVLGTLSLCPGGLEGSFSASHCLSKTRVASASQVEAAPGSPNLLGWGAGWVEAAQEEKLGPTPHRTWAPQEWEPHGCGLERGQRGASAGTQVPPAADPAAEAA